MSAGHHFLEELLSEMPFLDIERTQDVLEFGFDSAEMFYEWCWSHGWRNVMEPLTDEQLKGYRRGVFESIGDSPITRSARRPYGDRDALVVRVRQGLSSSSLQSEPLSYVREGLRSSPAEGSSYGPKWEMPFSLSGSVPPERSGTATRRLPGRSTQSVVAVRLRHRGATPLWQGCCGT